MHDAHAPWVLVEAGDQGADSCRHARECLPARRLGFAVGERVVERQLRVARREERQSHVGRGDAVEDDRTHMFAVLPQVDQCGPRPVRPAVEIDALVSQERPDIVEVVHGCVCCIEPDVGVIPFEAPAQPGKSHLTPLGELAQGVGARSAVERVGLACPALVDQDDVPGALHLAEDDAHLARKVGSGLAGPAGEKEEWILARGRCERWEHDNPQTDLSSKSCVPVFEHVDRPAERVSGAFAAGAGPETVERALGPGGSASPGQ